MYGGYARIRNNNLYLIGYFVRFTERFIVVRGKEPDVHEPGKCILLILSYELICSAARLGLRGLLVPSVGSVIGDPGCL